MATWLLPAFGSCCRHETVHVNLKEKPDWLFERNPLGAVPILEHNGRVVYESAICEEFLEEAFPGSMTGTHDLLPSCPYDRAKVRLLMLKYDKVSSASCYSAPDRAAEYCDDRVCVSVCLQAYLQDYTMRQKKGTTFLL